MANWTLDEVSFLKSELVQAFQLEVRASLEFFLNLRPVTLHHYSSLITPKLSEILEFRSSKLDDGKNSWGRVQDGSTEIQWKIVFFIFIDFCTFIVFFQTSLDVLRTIDLNLLIGSHTVDWIQRQKCFRNILKYARQVMDFRSLTLSCKMHSNILTL